MKNKTFQYPENKATFLTFTYISWGGRSTYGFKHLLLDQTPQTFKRITWASPSHPFELTFKAMFTQLIKIQIP